MNRKIWIIAVVIVGALAILKLVAKPSADQRAAAKRKIQDGALVLDVRGPDEYSEGHFEGAVNIPVQQLASRLAEVGALDRPVVVYCAAGVRAAQAKGILTKAGFKDVTNAGGLADLRR